MRNEYVEFRVYRCPLKPNERGEYIGKTPNLEQATAVVINAAARGRRFFIKGVRADGMEVLLL